MGRLEDIIERNKNPGKARKEASGAEGSASTGAGAGSGAADSAGDAAGSGAPAAKRKGLDGLSRLDQIVERNKHPGKYGRSGVTMGVLVAAFVFLILVLIVFTDLDDSPNAPEPTPAPAAAPSGEKRVNGVLMYREPSRTVRDAATD